MKTTSIKKLEHFCWANKLHTEFRFGHQSQTVKHYTNLLQTFPGLYKSWTEFCWPSWYVDQYTRNFRSSAQFWGRQTILVEVTQLYISISNDLHKYHNIYLTDITQHLIFKEMSTTLLFFPPYWRMAETKNLFYERSSLVIFTNLLWGSIALANFLSQYLNIMVITQYWVKYNL